MVCEACKQQQATGRALEQGEDRKGVFEGEAVPLKASRLTGKEREIRERERPLGGKTPFSRLGSLPASDGV